MARVRGVLGGERVNLVDHGVIHSLCGVLSKADLDRVCLVHCKSDVLHTSIYLKVFL